VIHDVLNQQSVHGILTKHSIAQNHGLFLTLVVFIEHDSHVCQARAYGYVTFSAFHNYGPFPKYSVLATGYAQFAVATFNPSYVVYFILWVHQITLPMVIMLHKEFQMESDSELFASGLYAICHWPKSILFGS
jgi:hypothetical protein